jgi:hypothetical protein
MLEDARVATPEDRRFTAVFVALGGCFSTAHFQLNLLGFLFVLATSVATIYHLLMFPLQWFH